MKHRIYILTSLLVYVRHLLVTEPLSQLYGVSRHCFKIISILQFIAAEIH